MGRTYSYHSIHDELWGDEKFDGLPFGAQGYFAFLCTGERSNVSGVMRATVRQFTADLSSLVSEEEARRYEEMLAERKLVVRDGAWIWVVNKFRRTGNCAHPNNLKSAGRDLMRCGSRVIFEAWQAKYAVWMKRIHAALGVREIAFAGEESEGPDPKPRQRPLIDVEPVPPPETGALYEHVVEGVWSHWVEVMELALGKRVLSILTPTRRQKILARMGDKIRDPKSGEVRGVTMDDLKAAISACAASEFHLGRHPKTLGRLYNSLERHILTNQEQFHRWLEVAAGAAKPPGLPVMGPAAEPAKPATGSTRPPRDDPRSKRPAGSRVVSLRPPKKKGGPDEEVVIR